MSQRLRRLFSSITVKLFLWFWLVTIISIFTTRFISTQLTDNGFIVPPHKGDIHRLHFLVNQFQSLNISPKKFFNRRLETPNTIIWLKQTDNAHVTSSQTRHFSTLARYIRANHFADLVTIQFPTTRLTGPIPFSFQKVPYQLFISTRMKRPPLGLFIMNLPHWARLIIPISISLLLCWLLAKTITNPLRQIKHAAIALGTGNLATRVSAIDQRTDEFGQLAKTFNQMAQQLEQSISAQQRLLGDISHELRSPMTRLQLAVALAQKSMTEPEELQRYLNRCEQEVSKLDEMISSVLHLSRLENAHQQLHYVAIDLQRFMQTLLDDAQFLAATKQITLHYQQASALTIQVDSNLLASAISNVLTNAVKYSPEQSHIFIHCEILPNTVEIVIQDQGGGVPEATLAQLFEPFYRINYSRERSSGGTGLGLAIAKQAVLMHQGSIEASNYHDDNQQQIGLRISIVLPFVQAAQSC